MTESTPEPDFSRQARGRRRGLLGEFWDYLRYSRKWWMLPILVIILVLGVLVLLSATGVGPFIYTLF